MVSSCKRKLFAQARYLAYVISRGGDLAKCTSLAREIRICLKHSVKSRHYLDMFNLANYFIFIGLTLAYKYTNVNIIQKSLSRVVVRSSITDAVVDEIG